MSSGTYILLKEKITKEELDIAEQKLIRFSNEFETLYGQHNVTINIHLAKHAGKSVRHLGPLWAQSAFGMEANNGVLKKTTAKNQILHQIAWKYATRFELSSFKRKTNDNIRKMSVGGKATVNLSEEDICTLSNFGCQSDRNRGMQTVYRFVLNHGMKFTSQLSKEIATIDYFVELKNGTIGAVKFYFVNELIIYGFMDKYEKIDHLDQFNIIRPSGAHSIFEVCQIEKKLIYMKMNNKEIITSIPNRYEKT